MATVLITGANRGIALELARRYIDQGTSVIAVSRSESGELNKLANPPCCDSANWTSPKTPP